MKNLIVHRRYMVLTAWNIMMIAVSPLFGRYAIRSLGVTILFFGMAIVAVWTISQSRKMFYAGIALGTAAFGTSLPATILMDLGRPIVILDLIGLSLLALFLGLIIVAIVRHILLASTVTLDTVFGGVCAYFLLGVLWAIFYDIALILWPGCLSHNGAPLSHSPGSFNLLLYFSYMTMTTVGYGDLVPQAAVTRVLACLQAVIGQIYLVVQIGGLVGTHFSSGRASTRHWKFSNHN